MTARSMRLLVAEDQLDDIFLLQEALSEMAESHYWRTWMKGLRPVFTDRMDDALRLLREDTFDAMLLSLALPDCRGLHTYMRARAEAPATPVVILADENDEALAVSAVREGAQDYIIKSELDCMPLARALRHAIDRQKLCDSLRRLSFIDELTGLYNLSGFLAFVDHDLRLNSRAGRNISLLLIEVMGAEMDGPPESPHRLARQQRDLALIETAEVLRPAFEDSAVIARVGADRFGVIAVDAGTAPSLEKQFQARLTMYNARNAHRCRLFAATGSASLDAGKYLPAGDLLQLAETTLCENKRGESPESRPRESTSPIEYRP
jgi:two-component system, cell cycle response regulator